MSKRTVDYLQRLRARDVSSELAPSGVPPVSEARTLRDVLETNLQHARELQRLATTTGCEPWQYSRRPVSISEVVADLERALERI